MCCNKKKRRCDAITNQIIRVGCVSKKKKRVGCQIIESTLQILVLFYFKLCNPSVFMFTYSTLSALKRNVFFNNLLLFYVDLFIYFHFFQKSENQKSDKIWNLFTNLLSIFLIFSIMNNQVFTFDFVSTLSLISLYMDFFQQFIPFTITFK